MNKVTKKTTKKVTRKIKKEKVSFCFLPFLFLLPLLSGCTGMRSKFDCNVSSGGGCVSMKQVNKMADYGAFSGDYIHKDGKRYIRANAKNKRDKKNKENRVNGYPLKAFEGSPIRSNESIQQIWIGPYEDKNGNYHEPSYVYTVIKKGTWLGEPANVIQD